MSKRTTAETSCSNRARAASNPKPPAPPVTFSPLVTRATPLSQGHGGRGGAIRGKKENIPMATFRQGKTSQLPDSHESAALADPPAWPISSEVPPSTSLFLLSARNWGRRNLKTRCPSLSFPFPSLPLPPTLEGKFFIYTINMT